MSALSNKSRYLSQPTSDIKPTSDINSDINSDIDICNICYEELQYDKKTPYISPLKDQECDCDNIKIHEDCLEKWYQTNNKCPICREQLYQSNQSNQLNQSIQPIQHTRFEMYVVNKNACVNASIIILIFFGGIYCIIHYWIHMPSDKENHNDVYTSNENNKNNINNNYNTLSRESRETTFYNFSDYQNYQPNYQPNLSNILTNINLSQFSNLITNLLKKENHT